MQGIIKQLEACHLAFKTLFMDGSVQPYDDYEESFKNVLEVHRALIDRLSTRCHCPLELSGISDLGECTYLHPGEECVFELTPEGK